MESNGENVGGKKKKKHEEEAGALLISHGNCAATTGSTVHILSPDTNVFVTAVAKHPELGQNALRSKEQVPRDITSN